MTRTDRVPPRTWVRRGIAGAAVAAAGLVAGHSGADASVRTTSEAIAIEADHALRAFDDWQRDRNPADFVRFVQRREATASLTASDLGLDAGDLEAAWAASPIEKQRAVLAAMSQLGVPYRSIASEPGVGFDCSGLTVWAFERAGVDIPRSSRDQFRAAEEIDRAAAEPGDLVYYPGHISLYLGLGTMVHSPNSGNHVEAVTLPTKRSVDFADPLGD